MRSVLTALCLFASTAHAVPAQFTHQGRLLDADGAPLEDEATIMFRVTNDEVGGDELWEETITVPLTNGFYSAVLGASEDNPLDTDVLSQAPVWLELQLDGEPAIFPRRPINAGPEESETAAPSEGMKGLIPVNSTNTEPRRNAEVTATIGATALTGAFGFGSVRRLAFLACVTPFIMSGNSGGSECDKSYLGYGILGGIAFGSMGYTNQSLYIMFSSSMLLGDAGGMLGASVDSEIMSASMGLLGGVGGAYLGYRLWRVRQPTGPPKLFKTPKTIWSRASLSPYLNRERSGLILSGRF